MRKFLRVLLSTGVLLQFSTCTANQSGSFGTVNIGGGGFGANFTWNNFTGGGGGAGIPAFGQPFQSTAVPAGYQYGANP